MLSVIVNSGVYFKVTEVNTLLPRFEFAVSKFIQDDGKWTMKFIQDDGKWTMKFIQDDG